MRVALYVRVSTDRQAQEGFSLDAQVRQMEKWAESQQHQVVEIYEEPGESATDDKRPAFQRLMADALSSEHPYDAIVTWSLSRFMREAYIFEFWFRKLKRAKVSILSITQPTSDDEAGDLQRKFINLMDEYASKENGKQVRRSMCDSAQKGFYNGSRAPFGFTTMETEVKGRSGNKRKLVPLADEATTVRLIYDLCINGHDGQRLGIKRIAALLNERGMLRRGRPWRLQGVHNVLHEPAYAGTYYYNRHDSRAGEARPRSEWIATPVPPIVTQEQFDEVAKLLDSYAPYHHDAKGPQSNTFLTGIAKCGLCGRNLVLMTGKSGVYEYYRCATRQSAGNKLCTCPNFRKDELNRVVVEAIAARILEPSRIMATYEELKVRLTHANAPNLAKEKNILRQAGLAAERLNNWHELVETGKIQPHAGLSERLLAMQRQIDSFTLEAARLRRSRSLPLWKVGPDQIAGFSEAVRKELLSPDGPVAKNYLRVLVSEIRVYPRKATITGSPAALVEAASKWKPGTKGMVPSFISEWRARQESNPRPPGS